MSKNAFDKKNKNALHARTGNKAPFCFYTAIIHNVSKNN